MNEQQQSIIQAIKALPRNERMALITKLGAQATIDADNFSVGRPDNADHYDKLLDTTDHDAIQKAENESKIMTGATHVTAEKTDKGPNAPDQKPAE